jgi:parallel beta-helix repeat protein
MSRTLLRFMAVAFVVAGGMLGQSLFASTIVAVGPSTCRPTLVHFATIQAAVNASPFNTTIMVCPGTYPEQVVISEPLTLQGVTDGTGNAAVITVPGGGLVVNATSAEFGTVTAQLLVENTVGVNVSDLTVDGTGGTCVAGANRTVGIEFYNVGTAVDGTSAGKVQNVVVRNQKTPCGIGEGILSDTAFMTISSNEFHDIDRTAILADRAKNSITNNSVQNSTNYGILLDIASGSVVSSNTVSNSTIAGILVEDATQSATISKNTVVNVPGNVGIYLYFAYYTTVTQNKVSNAAWPLVCQFCFFDTVQSNLLSEAFVDGILDQFSFGGNIITKNTVNEAPFGVFTDSSVGGDTLVPNSLFNVVVTVDPNPADSPAAPDNT